MLTYYAAQLGIALSAVDSKNNSNNRVPVSKGWNILNCYLLGREKEEENPSADTREIFLHICFKLYA